jgi:predicted nucleotidyltransferase
MLSQKTLEMAVQRLVHATRPRKVIVFGSYARGEASEDSDLDLLVITDEVEDRGREMVRMREAIGRIGIGVDLVVYSEAEAAERSAWCTNPVYWALREGRVLYDADQQRSTPAASSS